MPYDVFISYSRKDKNAVQSIIKHLDENGVSYWIDLEGIYSGEEFASVIYDNMVRSDVVLFISSKNSNQSQWVSGEIAMAVSLGKRIIPFRLDTAPYNGKIHLYLAALDTVNYYEGAGEALDKLIKSLRHSTSSVIVPQSTKGRTKKNGNMVTLLLCSILFVLIAVFLLLFFKNREPLIEHLSVNNANISVASIDTVNVSQRQVEPDVPSTEQKQEISTLAAKTGKPRSSETAVSDRQAVFEGNMLKLNIDGIKYRLIKVPGGDFMMGATGSQKEFAKEDEKNVRRVQMDSYYIGETEITVAMWDKVMGQTGRVESRKPKTNVSYSDCCGFCEALSKRLNMEIALPTEAEWEFAARYGTQDNDCIFSGSVAIDSVAWYSINAGALCDVAAKTPNRLGLYDMSGNVAEWCLDWYGRSYTVSQSRNPGGPYSGSEKVVRGGSFLSVDSECRTTARDHRNPDDKAESIGFRIVCHTTNE